MNHPPGRHPDPKARFSLTQSLKYWLDLLEQRSGSAIELGLERVAEVAARMALDFSDIPVITVTGTNGKGSVVAYLETLYRAAGYRTLAYTSPHLINFSERIRIDGQCAGDDCIATALAAVETARQTTRLTYFEHTTLAAFKIARDLRPDVMVLEVGLGGRLDAVNLADADVAVISSIDIDHTEWLGADRDAVAREKCGIARPGRPLIVGDPDPPPALGPAVAAIGAEYQQAGRDFDWRITDDGWALQVAPGTIESWPRPAMAGAHQVGNAACARMAARALQQRLPVEPGHFSTSLGQTRLPGRFQSLGGRPEIIMDVGHNPQAARILSDQLAATKARVLAVFAMLADKDVAGVATILNRHVDAWFTADLAGERGVRGEAIARILREVPVNGGVQALESVPRALDAARSRAGPADIILVFGSFHTVAEALTVLEPDQQVRSYGQST